MKRFCRGAALLLLICLGGLRFAQWGAQLTTDEAYTLNYAAMASVAQIRSSYDMPNNHILFSLLLHGLDKLAPERLLFVPSGIRPLQLLSIFASIATLALLYGVAAGLCRRRIAVLSVALLGMSSWHLMYSHMLRGYSLSVLLNLLAFQLTARTVRERSWAACAALAATIAACHYVVPTNVYFSLGLAAWSACLIQRERSRAPSAAYAHVLALLSAAFVGGFAVSCWLYLPIAGPLLASARVEQTSWVVSATDVGARLRQATLVLGNDPLPQAVFLLLSAFGAWSIARKRHDRVCMGPLMLFTLLGPIVILTLQRRVAPARVFLPALPFWAMLAGIGADHTIVRLRAAGLHVSRRLGLAGALAVLSMCFAPQAASYWGWNRGLGIADPMTAVVARAQAEDDFAIIVPPRGRNALIGHPLDWEYYAYSINARPYERTREEGDLPYLLRRKYYLVAADNEQVRQMMDRSDMDPFLRKSLRELSRFGKLGLYSVERSSAVLRDYREASEDPRLASALKAQALCGLGADALQRGETVSARGYFIKAERMSPSDAKIRFWVGFLHYLLNDDAAAAAEFAWVTTRDTSNIHAPLYYADALAGLGKASEARRWYEWYDRPDAPPAIWFLHSRAKKGLQALARAPTRPVSGESEIQRFDRLFIDALGRGSYERAEAAIARATAIRPDGERLLYWAEVHFHMQNFHRAGEICRLAQIAGAGVTADRFLANMLKMKFATRQAHDIITAAVQLHPDDAVALQILENIRRTPDLSPP